MTLRIVVDYEEDGPGWSEIFWNSNSSIDAWLQIDAGGNLLVGSPAQQLMVARLGMMVIGAKYTHIRVTNVADGTERSYDPPGTGYNLGLLVLPAAETWTKLLVKGEGGFVTRKNLWLGGLPELIVSPAKTYNPRPPWPDKFGAFAALMTAGGYGIYGRGTRTGAVPLTNFFTTSALGTFATAGPVPAGAPIDGTPFYVVLRGIRTPHGWNGVHRAYVAPAAPTTVVIGPTRQAMRSVPAWLAGSGGTIQFLAPRFTPFDRIRAVRLSKRNLGRPFGQPVGRRSR